MKSITDYYNMVCGGFDCPSFPDTIWNIVLVAGIEQHFTTPTGAICCKLVYQNRASNGTGYSPANVYVAFGPVGTTASIPSSNIIDGTGYMANPEAFTCHSSQTTISLIADETNIVTICFWSGGSGVIAKP